MTPPSDLILDCPAQAGQIDAWTVNFGGMTAIDNCDSPILSFSIGDTSNTCGNNQIVEYIFTASDLCGNSISEIAYVISQDTIDPVLTVPTAGTSNDCASAISTLINPWVGGATATDNCDDNPDITYSLLTVDFSCMGTNSVEEYTYLFVVTDACGNQSSGQSTFTVTDNTAPAITAPSNLTLACGNDLGPYIAEWLDDYTVTELCQDYTVTNSYDPITLNTCGSTTSVTWTIIDGCGAMSTATADIIITTDVIPPTFTNISDDITVNVDVDNCESSVVFSTPIGDDCNTPVSVTQIANAAGDLLPSGSEFPVGSTTIVFQVEDACGNTTLDSFDITVVDSQIPNLSCPSNEVVKCNDTGQCYWTADTSVDAIFADNCGGFDLSYVITGETTASGDSLPRLDMVQFALGTSTITYTLVDTMGNTTTCFFNVVVNDCESPVVTCPMAGDLLLDCGDLGNGAAITAWIATATFTDNCPDSTIITTVFNVQETCGMTSTTTYLFTATDGSGNTARCTAQVIVQDTMAPSIDAIAMPMTVECDGEGNNAALIAWLNNNGGATSSDECGTVAWSNNFTTLSNDCGQTGSALVTFTATDECGNTSTTESTFTIEDTAAPSITAPDDITLECGNANNLAIVENWIEGYVSSDICGSVTVTTPSATLPTNCTSGNNTLTLTWSVTDACGVLMDSDMATVTLVDNTKPVIMSPPTDLIVECTDMDRATLISNWEAAFGNGLVVDNCDTDVMIVFSAGAPTDDCGMTSTTQYSFVASDDCGNSVTTFANLIITDETAPNLTLPTATNTVECNENVEMTRTAWFDSASGTDDCGGTVTIEYNTPLVTTACVGSVTTITETYIFTATDECGNDSIATASFIIEDNTPPIIAHNTGNLSLSCGDDMATTILTWLNDVTVTETCQEYTISNDYDGSIPKCLWW